MKLNPQLCIGDSQHHSWLPQLVGINSTKLKPDAFVISRVYMGNHVPALDHRLFCCIRSLIEGKYTDAWSNEAIGQGHMYADKLSQMSLGDITILHILFIDQVKFRATRWHSGALFVYVDGYINSKGSATYLSRFLLGAADSSAETNPLNLLPTTPRVHELEILADIALLHKDICDTYRLDENPTLGKGSTGIVLRLREKKGGSTPRGLFAAKLVLASRVRFAINEETFYKNLRIKGLSDFPATKLLNAYTLSNNAHALILYPVGESFACTREAVESFVFALDALHKIGYIHGDARKENGILFNKRALLIDFSHSLVSEDTELRCDDFGRFFASVKGARCNDLDVGWRMLLTSVGLAGLIDKTLQHVNGVLSAVELVESFDRFT